MIAWEDLTQVSPEHGTVTREPTGFTVTAGAKTDAYTPPDGSAPVDRLPGLRLHIGDEPVRIAAAVTPQFTTTYDAGALVLRTGPGRWAKLAFERAPDGRTMAVSVVTADRSDDSNGPSFTAPTLHLRIYRDGPVTAFHISPDGVRWDLLRLFSLPGSEASIDFIAQSPMGEGASARFTHLGRITGKLADFRDGT